MTSSPRDQGDREALRRRVRELGPWRQDIDLGPFSTFDVIENPQGVWNAPDEMNDRWGETSSYLVGGGGRALDVGCNAGALSFRLEEEGFDVFGIDRGFDPGLEGFDPRCWEFIEGDREELPPADEWLQQGDAIVQAKFCAHVKDSGAEFAYGDAMHLPLDDNAADVVFAYGVIYHLHEAYPDRDRLDLEQEFIDECFRVATRQVLLEMPEEHPPRNPDWDYYWVPAYILKQGHRVQATEGGAPPGLRYVVAGKVR